MSDRGPSTDAKYRVLAEEIVTDIRRGKYAPGGRLPSVRDYIAAGHRESTVRRAMRWLQEEGWVRAANRGAGTFVADPMPDVQPTLEQRVSELERWRATFEDRDTSA